MRIPHWEVIAAAVAGIVRHGRAVEAGHLPGAPDAMGRAGPARYLQCHRLSRCTAGAGPVARHARHAERRGVQAAGCAAGRRTGPRQQRRFTLERAEEFEKKFPSVFWGSIGGPPHWLERSNVSRVASFVIIRRTAAFPD